MAKATATLKRLVGALTQVAPAVELEEKIFQLFQGQDSPDKVEAMLGKLKEYVTRDQFESGIRDAVGQAQMAAAESMRTSLRYRRSAGLG